MFARRHKPDLTKGLVAGVVGGLLASFLMEQFQSLWTTVSEDLNPHEDNSESKEDPATVKAAQAISTGLTHQKIPKENKAAAGEFMHYMMGGSSGAIYGVAAEVIPLATAGEGLAFGTSVWAAADNALVPALGLAKPPTKTPLSTHIYALSSHLFYGFVTEIVRRAIRGSL
jgi:putative membrane protein